MSIHYMYLLNLSFIVVSIVLAFFLLLPTFNVLLSGFFKEKLSLPKEIRHFDYACIITAYRNIDIAKGLVESLLRQSEPLHIYLVADACNLSGWSIYNEKISVLHPDPPLNLKAKSIIYAVEHFVRPHDFIVIFDADNLAHPDFLKEINRFANAGFMAIQGQRTAKNLDTPVACADALGEFYKNFIDRLAPFRNGSSAVISGSGMAVETSLYKAYLYSPEIEKGKHLWKKMLQEDKILQNFLLRKNIRIAYAWDAICYDEKVTSAGAVETQRSRWLFSYFQNIPNALGIIRRGFFGLRWNQILFGLVTLAPPMFIMLGLAALLAIIGLFLKPWISVVLGVSILVFIFTIFWTLHLSNAPREVWQAVFILPNFVWRQFRGLLKIGNPNRNFRHTEHSRQINIEEVLQKRN